LRFRFRKKQTDARFKKFFFLFFFFTFLKSREYEVGAINLPEVEQRVF